MSEITAFLSMKFQQARHNQLSHLIRQTDVMPLHLIQAISIIQSRSTYTMTPDRRKPQEPMPLPRTLVFDMKNEGKN